MGKMSNNLKLALSTDQSYILALIRSKAERKIVQYFTKNLISYVEKFIFSYKYIAQIVSESMRLLNKINLFWSEAMHL